MGKQNVTPKKKLNALEMLDKQLEMKKTGSPSIKSTLPNISQWTNTSRELLKRFMENNSSTYMNNKENNKISSDSPPLKKSRRLRSSASSSKVSQSSKIDVQPNSDISNKSDSNDEQNNIPTPNCQKTLNNFRLKDAENDMLNQSKVSNKNKTSKTDKKSNTIVASATDGNITTGNKSNANESNDNPLETLLLEDNILMPKNISDTDNNGSVASSPLRKNVAFSDTMDIESSPTQPNDIDHENCDTSDTGGTGMNDSKIYTTPQHRSGEKRLQQANSSPTKRKTPIKSILKNSVNYTSPLINNQDDPLIRKQLSSISAENSKLINQNKDSSKNCVTIKNTAVIPANKDTTNIFVTLETLKDSDDIDKNGNNNTNNRKMTITNTGKSLSQNITTDETASNPKNVNYWTPGWIHVLTSDENIKQFSDIIEGGLTILKKEIPNSKNSHTFEIYATFMNVINPNAINKTYLITELKRNVIIENLKNIITICLNNLKQVDDQHKKKENIKDPFYTRTYIQIIKFITFLLSDAKIVQAIRHLPRHYRNKFKLIFEKCCDTITSEDTTKSLLLCYMIFLRDELISPNVMNDDSILKFIRSFREIKSIDSLNFTLTKLSMIKSFLAKFPRLMLMNADTWFCDEILSALLFQEKAFNISFYNQIKIVLLEFFKIVFSNIGCYPDALYDCIENETVDVVLSNKYLEKLQSQFSLESLNSKTLGDLLRSHLKYLVTAKNNSKLAIDLWLSLTGILFCDADNYVKLLKMHNPEAKGNWLTIHEFIFSNSDEKTRPSVIKSWRIINYLIIMNYEKTPLNLHEDICDLLKKPVVDSLHLIDSPKVCMALTQYIDGLAYGLSETILCDKFLKDKFLLLWNMVVIPVFSYLLNNIALGEHCFGILLLFLNEQKSSSTLSETKRLLHDKKTKTSNPLLKIIDSSGINLVEISPFPLVHVDLWLPGMQKIVMLFLRSDRENRIKIRLLNALLKILPQAYIAETFFLDIIDVMKKIVTSVVEPGLRTLVFHELTVKIFTKFSSILFDSFNQAPALLVNYFVECSENLIKTDLIIQDVLSDLLKEEIFKNYEYTLYASFLNLNDTATNIYIIDCMHSGRLTTTVSNTELRSYVHILGTFFFISLLDDLLRLINIFEESALDEILYSVTHWKATNKKVEFMMNFLPAFKGGMGHSHNVAIIAVLRDIIVNRGKTTESFQMSLIRLLNIVEESHVYVLYGDFIQSLDLTETIPYMDETMFKRLCMSFKSANIRNKFAIFERLVENESLLEMERLTSQLMDILFDPYIKQFRNRKEIIARLYSLSFTSNRWTVFSELVQKLTEKGEVSFNAEFFLQHSEHVHHILSSISAEAIFALFDNCGAANDLIENGLRNLFKRSNITFAMAFLRSCNTEKKNDIFERFLEDIIALLMDSYLSDKVGVSRLILRDIFLKMLQLISDTEAPLIHTAALFMAKNYIHRSSNEKEMLEILFSQLKLSNMNIKAMVLSLNEIIFDRYGKPEDSEPSANTSKDNNDEHDESKVKNLSMPSDVIAETGTERLTATLTETLSDHRNHISMKNNTEASKNSQNLQDTTEFENPQKGANTTSIEIKRINSPYSRRQVNRMIKETERNPIEMVRTSSIGRNEIGSSDAVLNADGRSQFSQPEYVSNVNSIKDKGIQETAIFKINSTSLSEQGSNVMGNNSTDFLYTLVANQKIHHSQGPSKSLTKSFTLDDGTDFENGTQTQKDDDKGQQNLTEEKVETNPVDGDVDPDALAKLVNASHRNPLSKKTQHEGGKINSAAIKKIETSSKLPKNSESLSFAVNNSKNKNFADEDHEKPSQNLKFPIFNSLKLKEQKIELDDDVTRITIQPPRALNGLRTFNGTSSELFKVQKPSLQRTTIRNTKQGIDTSSHDVLNVNDSTDTSILMQENGEQTQPDLTASLQELLLLRRHFPTKKSRKLVSRLRNFQKQDLIELGAAERRNLRVEILDFMMKLDFYNSNDMLK